MSRWTNRGLVRQPVPDLDSTPIIRSIIFPAALAVSGSFPFPLTHIGAFSLSSFASFPDFIHLMRQVRMKREAVREDGSP